MQQLIQVITVATADSGNYRPVKRSVSSKTLFQRYFKDQTEPNFSWFYAVFDGWSTSQFRNWFLCCTLSTFLCTLASRSRYSICNTVKGKMNILVRMDTQFKFWLYLYPMVILAPTPYKIPLNISLIFFQYSCNISQIFP